MTDLHAPPIEAHRVLGDGRSVALLRDDAEVDWWCAPAMDDLPLCWSLLDAQGARARYAGCVAAAPGEHLAGPTLRTLLHGPGGRVECWDGALVLGERPTLVRLVRALDGPLDIVHELSLGGFDQPWARWGSGAATVGDRRVAVRGGAREDTDGDRVLCSRLRAPRGRWAGLTVALGGAVEQAPADLAAALNAADARARSDRRRVRLPRHYPQRAVDALAVLTACSYAPTGAVIAAPTTSLPEWPGGERQFDYRYTWLRDASIAVSTAALLGRPDLAQAHLEFLHRISDDGRQVPRAPVCDVRGGRVPDEREVGGIDGWAGSRPVRVGNGAAGQVQVDALGLCVESISVYLQEGGRLEAPTWRLVRTIADHLAETEAPQPTHGIWELRTPRLLTSADIGRWIGLDRAVWIARGWRPTTPRRHWLRARAAARRRVLEALRPDGLLPRDAGEDPPQPDAAALMAPLFRLVDRRDPRAGSIVQATMRALAAGDLLYRYPPGGDADFPGEEGAFLPVTWWTVSALAAIGEVQEARRRGDALDRSLPRLLAEEADPATGAALGNAPLLWSHMEAARAAYLLDAADLRDRFTVAGLGAWRLARYLAMRARRG